MSIAFRPDFTLEGDPQRNQNQFLVLTADEPFEIMRVEYVVEGRTLVTQTVETSLDVSQRVQLLPDTLRKLRQGSLLPGDWPVEVAVRCRQLSSETNVKHSFLLQACRKPGILKLAVRKTKLGARH